MYVFTYVENLNLTLLSGQYLDDIVLSFDMRQSELMLSKTKDISSILLSNICRLIPL